MRLSRQPRVAVSTLVSALVAMAVMVHAAEASAQQAQCATTWSQADRAESSRTGAEAIRGTAACRSQLRHQHLQVEQDWMCDRPGIARSGTP